MCFKDKMQKRLLCLIVVLTSGLFPFSVEAQKYVVETIWSKGNFPTTEKEWLDRQYKGMEHIGWQKLSTGKSISKSGWIHNSYALTIDGIPVEKCKIHMHSLNSVLQMVNGYVAEIVAESRSQVRPLEECKELLVNYVCREMPMMKSKITLVYSGGDLVYFPMDYDGHTELRLAYRFEVTNRFPLVHLKGYVSAEEGSILSLEDVTFNAIAQAETLYSGLQEIYTDGRFLADNTRGRGYSECRIPRNENELLGIPFFDFNQDNYWSAQEFSEPYEQAALDVHWGTMKTYDFFLQNFSFNILEQFRIISYLDPYLSSSVSASSGEIYYGQGNPSQSILSGPLTSLDIVSHEVTHLVDEEYNECRNTPISEAIADIFSMSVVHDADVGKQPWAFGQEVTTNGLPIRCFDDPHICRLPDTYGGQYWNTSSQINTVDHVNSAILTHWFYLLVEGGSGVNDLGDSYSVDGIGFESAENIVFNAWINYHVTEAEDFFTAAQLLLLSAVELYGYCSDQTMSVANALKAIGLPTFITIPPMINLSDEYIDESNLTLMASYIYASGVLPQPYITLLATDEIHLQCGFHAVSSDNFTVSMLPCAEIFDDQTQEPLPAPRRAPQMWKGTLRDEIENGQTETKEWADTFEGEYTYYIYDPLGRLVQSGHSNGEGINISVLSDGTYIVWMQDNTGKKSFIFHK